MKTYSRFLSLENIDKIKFASEASQANFAFLTTNYEPIAKLQHLILPKVGKGEGINLL